MSSPNRTLKDMSIEELKAEYAHWDMKVRQAATWGSAMAFADEQRKQAEAEIQRRRSNV